MRVSRTKRVDRYLKELIEVGKRHGFCLAHEDSQGAFIVEARSTEEQQNDRDFWLLEAEEDI